LKQIFKASVRLTIPAGRWGIGSGIERFQGIGYERKLNARIVHYADEFVILCVNKGQEVYAAMKRMMERLGLKVNEDKTRLCRAVCGLRDTPLRTAYTLRGNRIF